MLILLASLSMCSCARTSAPTVDVVIDPNRTYAVSPYIYGTNQLDFARDAKRFTLVRQGGNRMTAYNWENNASNAGNDWQHQSDDYLGGGDVLGEVVRSYMMQAKAAKMAFVGTIQMAGYVAADKLAGGDVNQTPNYLATRFVPVKARKGAAFEAPPNLKDGAVYMDEFAHWARQTAGPEQPLFWCLDNEPTLWSHTHARIHPEVVTYKELIAKSLETAAAVKDADPKTLIFGPVSFGWSGFESLNGAPDAAGRHFLDVYLDEFAKAEKSKGERLLDVLDVHWYPETRGGGERIASSQEKPGMAEARLQAPRAFWDEAYREDSWIQNNLGDKPIRLLPMLREKVAAQYPGTKLAITEYNFGGGESISGALAQADVLGVFGREGVFAACLWSLDEREPFLLAGFDAFRDYDGAGARFGEVGLSTTVSDATKASVYASRVGRKTVVVAINKTSEPLALSLLGAAGKIERAFQLDGSAPKFRGLEKPSSSSNPTLAPLSVTVFEFAT